MPRQTGVLIGIGTVALIGLGCTLVVGLINLSTWLNQPSPPAPPTFSPVGDRLPILLPQPLSQTIRGYARLSCQLTPTRTASLSATA